MRWPTSDREHRMVMGRLQDKKDKVISGKELRKRLRSGPVTSRIKRKENAVDLDAIRNREREPVHSFEVVVRNLKRTKPTFSDA